MIRILLLFAICSFSATLFAQSPLFTQLNAAQTGINFTNSIVETSGRNIGKYDYFYNGAGLAIGDLTNDGLPDIFFAGNDVDDQLFINQGNWLFLPRHKQAGIETGGWSTGITMVDINNDKWLDIYVCRSGPDYQIQSTPNKLYVNQQNGTFVEMAKEYGIAGNELSTQAVFFDMDNDGDLDLFVLNHGVRNMANQADEWVSAAKKLPPAEYRRYCNSLYRNDEGRFTDITESAGLLQIGFGLGVAISDFDRNGWLDIYVANDFFLPDNLWMMQADGQYLDQIKSKFPHTTFSSMGCDAADFNNDNWSDLVVLDMSPSNHEGHMKMAMSMSEREMKFMESMEYTPQYMYNGLYANNGLGVMVDIARMAGVHSTDWSWGPLLADFDNDGWKDLFITNGVLRETMNGDWRLQLISAIKKGTLTDQSYYDLLQKAEVNPVPNFLFQNLNGWEWKDQSVKWGIAQPGFSNGAACGDLDVDGDLDLVVNNLDQEAFIYRNNSNQDKHFLRIKFTIDTVQLMQVQIFTGEYHQTQYPSTVRGFQSSVEPVIHFGLGNIQLVDSVVFIWQNGMVQKINKISADQVLEISYNSNEETPIQPTFTGDSLLFINQSSRLIRPSFFHTENVFDEGRLQRFIPHSLSHEGPAIAVADVNGDGLDDFYAGGAKGQVGVLYLQQKGGSFQPLASSSFNDAKEMEEVNALFFDVDSDSDPDLYVAGGGGGDMLKNLNQLQDRLYINDGNGNFTLKALPDTNWVSTKAIAPCDYDSDGDIDLFIGGRNTPGKYPQSPPSFLLENRNGELVNVTKERAPALLTAGMVTDAVWMDWDDDGLQDLIVVGEWMAPTVYRNTVKGLIEIRSTILDSMLGWWSCVVSGDLDGDGDLDLILGNLGNNNHFNPSAERPLYLYSGDFDENGSFDLMIAQRLKNQIVPLASRDAAIAQLPDLVTKFPDYNSWANADINDVISEKATKLADVKQINNLSTYALLNIGDGLYERMELPAAAQVSPVNGAIIHDFDADGYPDILLSGNNSRVNHETTPYDAGTGLFLKGLGKAQFETVFLSVKSGVFLPGDVRSVHSITIDGVKPSGVLVGKNNSRLNLLVWDR